MTKMLEVVLEKADPDNIKSALAIVGVVTICGCVYELTKRVKRFHIDIDLGESKSA